MRESLVILQSRSTNIFERHKVLTGVCIAILICGIVLAIAELTVRILLPQIQFVGQSASLFQSDRFGGSTGNRPLSVGESWGARVVTDQFGFRVASGQPRNSPERCTTIIIGDSVPFGLGIGAEHTFPTMLAQGLADPLCNAAVTGYGIDNYMEFVDNFVLPYRENLKISNAILFITLNDIHGTNISTEARTHIIEQTENPIERIARAVTSIFDFNAFLYRRSKLYLAIKGFVYDSSRWWFLSDYEAYFDAELVESFSTKLIGLIEKFRDTGVSLNVFVLPYEYQLRLADEELMHPQRMLNQVLADSGVPYWDLYTEFASYNNGTNSKDLFLFNDHCHLSKAGHALVADLVLQKLNGIEF